MAEAQNDRPGARVRIQALGGYRIVVDGRDLRLRTRKEALLLLRLVLGADDGVSRDECIVLLWPDSSEARARHSLSEALRGIELATGLVVGRTPERLVLAASSHSFDVRELDEAIAAGDVGACAQRHRGGFLAGWYPPTAEASHWVDGVGAGIATRLEKSMRHELAARRQATDSRGVTVAVAVLEQLGVATTEDREAAAEAEQITAWESLRAGDSIHTRIPIDREGPFVGRVEEMKVLTRELELAMKGEVRVVLVSGEAGIGKTRTCQRLARLAALRGARLFLSTCYELEQSVAYGAISETFRDSISAVDAEKLKPIWRESLSAVLSAESLGEGPSQFPAPHLLLDAFAGLFNTLGDNRLPFILVEDLQWCDASTAQVMHYMLRRSSPLGGAMVVLAYRDEDIHQNDAARVLVDNLLEAGSVALRLARMQDEEIRLQVRNVIGKISVDVDAIVALADGNPFLAHELSLARPGSGSSQVPPIADVIAERAGRLPSTAREILDTLVIAGTPLSVIDLAGLTGQHVRETLRHLDTLYRIRLARPAPEGAAVGHDIIRVALGGKIPPAVRQSLHAYLAKSLRDTASDAFLAQHFADAGLAAEALHHAGRAAEASKRRRAYHEEVRWLTFCIDYAGNAKPQYIDSLVDRLFELGRFAEAIEIADRYGSIMGKRLLLKKRLASLKLATFNNASLHLDGCDDLAENLISLGMGLDAAEVFREAARLAQELNDGDLMLRSADRLLALNVDGVARVHATAIALLKFTTYRPLAVRPLLEALRTQIADWGTETLPNKTLGVIGFVDAADDYNAGRVSSAGTKLVGLIRIARRNGNLADELRIRALLVPICGDAMRFGRARRHADFVAQYAPYASLAWEQHMALMNLAATSLDAGNIVSAEAWARNILSSPIRHPMWILTAYALAISGHIALQRSDCESAAINAEELATLLPPISEWVSDNSLVATFMFRQKVVSGRLTEALQFLEEAHEHALTHHQVAAWILELERHRLAVSQRERPDQEALLSVADAAARNGCRSVAWKAKQLLAGNAY